MNAPCQDLRDQVASIEEGRHIPCDELRGHLAQCAACTEWLVGEAPILVAVLRVEPMSAPESLAARVDFELGPEGREVRAAGALGSLRSLEVPAQLEGRVVAALHAGHREERLKSWLRSGLPPLQAPPALERRVAAALARDRRRAASGAPAELDFRVDHELRDPEGAIAGRFAARLQPQPAPDALRERILGPEARRRRWATVAACLLAVSAWAFSALRSGPRDAAREPEMVLLDRPKLDFEVWRVAPAALEQSFVELAETYGVTGGLSQVASTIHRLPASWAEDSARTPIAPTAQGTSHEPADAAGSKRDGADEDGRGLLSTGSRSAAIDQDTASLLERISTAPFDLKYAGRRHVEMFDPGSGASLDLIEQVRSDGRGGFSVDLVEGGADEFSLLLHSAREGFIHRYRDFRIRDLAAFLESFEIRILPGGTTVAGRRAVELEIARREDPLSHYSVAIDPENGLVLRFEERIGPKQELVARIGFDSLSLDPQIDPAELSGGPSVWIEFDLGDIPRRLGVELRAPTYVPRRHAFDRAAFRTDITGRMWVEFVYGDGVEQVFFLHADPGPGDGSPPHGVGLSRGGWVRVSTIGAWNIVEGEVNSVRVAAMGKCPLEELLLLIQSAFAD